MLRCNWSRVHMPGNSKKTGRSRFFLVSKRAGGIGCAEKRKFWGLAMGLPPKQGLYDPRNEHDSCGVGFVANIKGAKSHEHHRPGPAASHQSRSSRRGGRRSAGGRWRRHPDSDSRSRCSANGPKTPASPCRAPGQYAVAMCFLPREAKAREIVVKQFEHFIKVEGQKLLGWRDVPTDPAGPGQDRARPACR